jgi:hypothetical protein
MGQPVSFVLAVWIIMALHLSVHLAVHVLLHPDIGSKVGKLKVLAKARAPIHAKFACARSPFLVWLHVADGEDSAGFV